jgi:hypothetical protein
MMLMLNDRYYRDGGMVVDLVDELVVLIKIFDSVCYITTGSFDPLGDDSDEGIDHLNPLFIID